MLYTKTGMQIAQGYMRVVHGGRGAYVELMTEQLLIANVHVPNDQMWRYTHDKAFYIEYRTTDAAHVKIYHQKRTVSYADYLVGMCYISPDDLYVMVDNQLQLFKEGV